MSENTNTTKTTQTTKLHSRTLSTLITKTADLAAVESSGAQSIDDAKWEAFGNMVAAYRTLGEYLVGDTIGRKLSGKVNGSTIHTAMTKTEDSPIFVASSDRKGLPSQAKMSRAVDLSSLKPTEQEMSDYRASGSTPNIADSFIPWMHVLRGDDLGNGSTVDVTKTKHADNEVNIPAATDDGKARTIMGPIVRKPGAGRKSSPATSTVATTGWGHLESASDDRIAELSTVVDWSGHDDATLTKLAESAVAEILRRQRAASTETKTEDLIVIPTV